MNFNLRLKKYKQIFNRVLKDSISFIFTNFINFLPFFFLVIFIMGFFFWFFIYDWFIYKFELNIDMDKPNDLLVYIFIFTVFFIYVTTVIAVVFKYNKFLIFLSIIFFCCCYFLTISLYFYIFFIVESIQISQFLSEVYLIFIVYDIYFYLDKFNLILLLINFIIFFITVFFYLFYIYVIKITADIDRYLVLIDNIALFNCFAVFLILSNNFLINYIILFIMHIFIYLVVTDSEEYVLIDNTNENLFFFNRKRMFIINVFSDFLLLLFIVLISNFYYYDYNLGEWMSLHLVHLNEFFNVDTGFIITIFNKNIVIKFNLINIFYLASYFGTFFKIFSILLMVIELINFFNESIISIVLLFIYHYSFF